MKITFWLLFAISSLAFTFSVRSQSQPVKAKTVWILLKSKDLVRGELVLINNEEVQFKVKNILQVVPIDDVAAVHFTAPPPGFIARMQNSPTPTPTPTPMPTPILLPTPTSNSDVTAMTASLRPTILWRERAVYTDAARKNHIQGAVILQLVYSADGRILDIKVVRGLPDGLTDSAITAAKKIKFKPAEKDGKPVSVRGNVEFNFSLYTPIPPSLISPTNGKVFSHVPRTTKLEWSPVRDAVKYNVEVQYGMPDGSWWSESREFEATNNEIVFEFWGAQPGRWRVSAIYTDNSPGPVSPWAYFRYSQ